jgi:hypothetical protein
MKKKLKKPVSKKIGKNPPKVPIKKMKSSLTYIA